MHYLEWSARCLTQMRKVQLIPNGATEFSFQPQFCDGITTKRGRRNHHEVLMPSYLFAITASIAPLTGSGILLVLVSSRLPLLSCMALLHTKSKQATETERWNLTTLVPFNIVTPPEE